MCQRALTQRRTLWGGGALEVGDLCLLEDSSERGGALGSDEVASETASEGWDGDGERVGVSRRADTKANTSGAGWGALELGDLRLIEDGSQRGDALGSYAIAPEIAREGYGKR